LALVTKGLPEALSADTHCCLQHLPITEQKTLVKALNALIMHTNAPTRSMCCPYHSSALHLLAGLRTIFLSPCNPLWFPINGTMCPSCGMLISAGLSCFFCMMMDASKTHYSEKVVTSKAHHMIADASKRNHSDMVVTSKSHHMMVDEQYLTNNCINLLRHVGPTDMAEAMKHLARATRAIRTHPKWTDFWKATALRRDWNCPTCGAPNEVHDAFCFICRNKPYDSSSED